MPSYNPNKRCCEEKVGLDELLPSMEALETVPISPQYPHSQPASSGKLVFRSIRNLASVSRSNFLMESWTVLFLEKWHPPSFHPLYFSPSTWTEGGREGGRVIYIVEGCHGKTRNITGFCRMWSWIILSRVKYLQTGLRDVVVRP